MRRAAAVVVLGALTAGCTGAGGPDGDGKGGARPADLAPRMAQAAGYWEGADRLARWRAGFHAMGDVTRPPAGGFHDAADRIAYQERNFTIRGDLPREAPRPGQARAVWADGTPLPVTPLSAADTYATFDLEPDRGHALVVTGARLGELPLSTSRGPATVPAWFFTLEGYESPLARVAIDLREHQEPVITRPAPETGGLTPLFGHRATGPEATSFTVFAERGVCEAARIEVLEGSGAVVLGGYARPLPGAPDACDASRQADEVRVTLSAPLGDRAIVDARTSGAIAFFEGTGKP
ncbi:hypothetical protein [Streptomyces sp. NPDC058622]|uniref:hypothetical protein n=1 Tax=Streptomyces sp. NPDC058622 TaxID=3346562 RepID=UPI00365A4E0B